jgi:DNA polymerase elongation subunit (family B)
MKLAVLDLETDPFEHGQMVRPFVAGFHDGARTITWWSPDCIAQSVAFLEKEMEPWCIYAHNGGRFDFFYYLRYLSSDIRIINGRIIQAHLGKHELRDSFAIMPFPLADYDKDSIDYQKMRNERREQHKAEILKYLSKDLTALYELVTAFHKEFGPKLTVGSASMKEIKARHKFKCGGQEYDSKFRSSFYFGGRVQVFRPGITTGEIKIVDVNSMYPFVMSSYLHPIGIAHTVDTHINRDTCFVVAKGYNYGAFPAREKDGSLNFTREFGEFSMSIHEWQAAEETGSFRPTKVKKTYGWRERGCFDDWVNHFYNARATAKKDGDKIKTIFYKYVLNSGYGKFAQNPDNYFDWYVTKYGEFPPEYPGTWEMAYIHDGEYIIWRRPLATKFWYNIATGASITGAARAVLLKGIHATQEPLYCDTDAIICRGASHVPIHPTNLGQWDCEATGRVVAIAGKKLYALLGNSPPKDAKEPEKIGDLWLVKKAHKGVRLTGAEIFRVAKGETVEVGNPVPKFRLDGTWSFTKRKIRRTT